MDHYSSSPETVVVLASGLGNERDEITDEDDDGSEIIDKGSITSAI
jgi:hypothetical protein